LISNVSAAVCALLVFVCGIFLVCGFSQKKNLILSKKLYLILCAVFLTWPLALIGMRFTSAENIRMLTALDACTYLAASVSPVMMLILVVTFVTNCEKLPRWCYLLLIVPLITNIVVWTNPLHHLQYQVFSVIRTEIVFGPYVYISGAYTYFILMASVITLIRFAFKNNFRLFWAQVLVLIIGVLVPLFTSCYATFSGANVSIAATPISFVITLICNYIAIFRLHLLDIVPVATQHILDWIPDGYLILSEDGLVVDDNKHFRQVFGKQYQIASNRRLRDSLKGAEGERKTAIYQLVSALDNSAKSHSPVAYEQAVSVEDPDGTIQKCFYMVDITPLEVSNRMVGFVVMFKDITQVKKTMQQVQENQAKMMEQERLALLGQMVGGLAHNLKTPIMGIAGCSSSIESLLTEEDASLGDPEVTDDDFREIHGEIRDWLSKIRSSCSYMSDIITAIKGQAASANANAEGRDFTLDELLKRTLLLMRHELQSNGCSIVQDSVEELRLMMRGDINSLVQVLNNLISNAIYAEQDASVKEIRIGVTLDNENLSIFVQDSGPGIPPHVLEKLFQEMTTTKGTKGTGLGLYISNTVIRGKFGGHMWAKNSPSGGAIIGFSIPLENAGTVQVERIREVL